MKKPILILFVLLTVGLLTALSEEQFVTRKIPLSTQLLVPSFPHEAAPPPVLSAPPQSRAVTLVAVGDIMPSRAVERKLLELENFDYPFSAVSRYLQSAYLVFGNLESPLVEGRLIADHEMTFRSNPEMASALHRAGFTLLSIANNHSMNFGEEGIRTTIHALRDAGLQFMGAGETDAEAHEPTFTTVHGLTFAFLAYTDFDVVPDTYEATADHAGVAFMNLETLSGDVAAVRASADFVIVSMHSGVEYAASPDTFQQAFAHQAIDAGADLVIGHHPHVVQTMERYKDRYIFYSLGNFIFDQMWSQETREGLMITATFQPEGISSIALIPVRMNHIAQPDFLQGRDAERVLKRLKIPESESLSQVDGVWTIVNRDSRVR